MISMFVALRHFQNWTTYLQMLTLSRRCFPHAILKYDESLSDERMYLLSSKTTPLFEVCKTSEDRIKKNYYIIEVLCYF